jgi:hypothetical protein
MIEANASRALIRTYSPFKSEWLSANIKLTRHKSPIRSVITYFCPAWEFVADTHLLKLQRLQNKFLRKIGNFPRHTAVRELFSIFRTFTIMKQSCAGEKQKSYKIIEELMSAM